MRAEAEAELRRLAHESGGLLKPSDVVEAARDPDNPLHREFEWDDAAAAQHYRIEQARKLIARVKVTMPEHEERSVLVRAYVSLPSDRIHGSGYRPIEQVMSDASMRAELLQTALREVAEWRQRYQRLSELASVFEAIEEVQKTG